MAHPARYQRRAFLLGIVGGAGYLIYSLSDEAAGLIETLPEAAQKFRQTLNKERNTSDGAIKKVQKAATQIEQAANETAPATPTPSGVTRVQIEKPKINVKDYLLLGTLGAVGPAAQAGIVLFLAYFLLMSGDTFRRKLVKITGPTLSNKKITLQVLDEINNQIQRYMLVMVFTSAVVGLVTWAAFSWIGLEHAAIWGITAGLFNTIPYLGPVVVTGGNSICMMIGLGQCGILMFLCTIVIKEIPGLARAIGGGVHHNVSAITGATFGAAAGASGSVLQATKGAVGAVGSHASRQVGAGAIRATKPVGRSLSGG